MISLYSPLPPPVYLSVYPPPPGLSVCLSELERLSGLVGRPSESHPLHNSGLLSLDPVQDKTPLYSQLLQAYKWSNKVNLLTCSTLHYSWGFFIHVFY